jgi:hypothetical protein
MAHARMPCNWLAEPLPSRYLGLSGNSTRAGLSQTKRDVFQALTQEMSAQNGRQSAWTP